MPVVFAERRFEDARQERSIRENRDAHDAVCEVPHRLDPVDRFTLRWIAFLAVLTALLVWWTK